MAAFALLQSSVFFLLSDRIIAASAAARIQQQHQQDEEERSTQNTKARRCGYEGNCPALTFCGISGHCVPYLHRGVIQGISRDLNGSISNAGGLQPIAVSGDATADPSTLTIRPKISSNVNINTTTLTHCLHQCIIDIIWDERYYFLSTVNITHHQPHLSPGEGPDGCVVIYERHGPSNIYHPKESWHVRQPTTDEWREKRMGVLVRRDAVPESDIGLPVGKKQVHRQQQRQRWAVLCYNACQHNEDCIGKGLEQQQRQAINENIGVATRNFLDYFSHTKAKRREVDGFSPSGGSGNMASFQCDAQRSACQRTNKNARSNYVFDHEWGQQKLSDNVKANQTSDLVVLSYASDSYMKGLSELAASLRYWAPHVRLCVYSLGLSTDNVRTIEAWPNVIEVVWRNGYPKGIPPHATKGKVYAWKPIAIAETVKRFGKVLIFDAGSVIRGPLDPVERILESTGIFLVWGQDDNMMPKAHEKIFEWFNYTKSTFVAGPHYSGNTQGYLYPSEWFDNIVLPSYKCAMDKECIQPEGSSLSNHRYDQTSLSIIAYQHHVMAQPHTEFLASSNPQTNFRQPAEKLIWTARSGSNHYFSSGY